MRIIGKIWPLGLLASASAAIMPLQAATPITVQFEGTGSGKSYYQNGPCSENGGCDVYNSAQFALTFDADDARASGDGLLAVTAGVDRFGFIYRTLAYLEGDTLFFEARSDLDGRSNPADLHTLFRLSLNFEPGYLGLTFPTSFNEGSLISGQYFASTNGCGPLCSAETSFGTVTHISARLGESNPVNFGYITTTGVGAVPEPTTWALMLLGFGFIGRALRSAKRHRRGVISAKTKDSRHGVGSGMAASSPSPH